MFFVIDKSKIYSYIIAICTVVILFVAAAGLSNNTNMNTQQTSANATTQQNAMESNNVDSNTINNLINCRYFDIN